MQKTNFDYEILIGEDCSTDNTRLIVEEYVQKYPEKIRIITSENNVGAKVNSKRVFNASKGKYIADCEGDDYWIDPYKLQKQVDYLEGNSECTLCFHNAYIQNVRKDNSVYLKNTLINKANPNYRGANSNYNTGELALLGFIPTASYIYPKHIMESPPKWYEYAIVGDNAMKLIASSKGYAHYLDEVMSVYRVGVKGSVTDNWRKESLDVNKQINKNKGFIELFENINKFSDYKYYNELDLSKIPFEVQIHLLERNKKELKKARYSNYVANLSIKDKLKYYIRLYFPNNYILLLRFRKYLLMF
ncbi:glycosyltransferase [Psychrobacillus sp. NPDC058041]|uniref:glycosyltransferase n=1 Tax=Psychrobacillus sp. NPDC058041 TaxID=3346310 RepID=UPI0036D9B378